MRRSATCLTAGLLLSILLAACGPGNAPPDLEKVRSMVAAGDGTAALIELRRYLQSLPDSSEARLLLGRALLSTGDAVAAEVELRKALSLGAARTSGVPLVAQAMLQQQKNKELTDQFDTVDLGEVAAQNELDAALSVAWARLGKRERAKALVDGVLKRTPDHVSATLSLARLEATDGRLDEALAMVQRIVARDERNADALEGLAQLQLYGKKDLDAADATYKRLLAVVPAHAPAHAQRVAIALARGDRAAAAAAQAAMQAALPRHPQTRLTEAQIAMANGDHRRASDLLLNLLKGAPDNPQVLILAGQAALALNDTSSAIGMLQKAAQVAPDSVLGKTVLARAYLRGGQPARAVQTLTPAVIQAPLDPEALRTLAEAELLSGQPARAEVLFQRALKAKPGDPGLRAAPAMSQLRKGQTAAAITELRDLARTEKDPTGDLALISVLMNQKDADGALTAIAGLEAKLPQSPQPDVLRGQVKLEQGDRAAARTHFDAALKKDANYLPAAQGLAQLDEREGRLEQARQRYADILQREPKNVGAMLAVVQITVRGGGAAAEVDKLLDEAIKVAPSDPLPRLVRIRVLAERRDWKSALNTAQSAASALPDNTDVLAALGRMQLLSGDSNQAVATLAKLAARDAQSAQAQLMLADAYVHTDDLAAAERSYKRALELAPGLAEAQRGLIAISVRTKNPARALEAARAMQRQQPDTGVGYMLEGDVHRQFNDWDAAVRAYRAGLAKGNFVGLSERLYVALGRSKGKPEAQAFAEDWLKRHPEDAGLPFFLGNQAMTENDMATAERHFATAHKVAPRLLGPLNNLAWVRAKLGRPDGVTLAQQALALAPDDANTLDTLVFALTQAQRLPEALEAVRAAVARAPRHLPHRYLLARTLADGGDKAGARAEIDRIAAANASFAARPEIVALRARVAN